MSDVKYQDIWGAQVCVRERMVPPNYAWYPLKGRLWRLILERDKSSQCFNCNQREAQCLHEEYTHMPFSYYFNHLDELHLFCFPCNSSVKAKPRRTGASVSVSVDVLPDAVAALHERVNYPRGSKEMQVSEFVPRFRRWARDMVWFYGRVLKEKEGQNDLVNQGSEKFGPSTTTIERHLRPMLSPIGWLKPELDREGKFGWPGEVWVVVRPWALEWFKEVGFVKPLQSPIILEY